VEPHSCSRQVAPAFGIYAISEGLIYEPAPQRSTGMISIMHW